MEPIPIFEIEVSHERRRWPRASSLIGKETLKKRISNNECRILLRRTSVEVMYSVYFKKRQSEASGS
jgi:hypothetical protein